MNFRQPTYAFSISLSSKLSVGQPCTHQPPGSCSTMFFQHDPQDYDWTCGFANVVRTGWNIHPHPLLAQTLIEASHTIGYVALLIPAAELTSVPACLRSKIHVLVVVPSLPLFSVTIVPSMLPPHWTLAELPAPVPGR